ncbi:DUF3265 domain-containing protein [Vibrio pelagius]|uniref:DUF3265 domain-containing protein n=1 Tax=Vibrio pelagius TaxID=28169 RepID=A0ABY5GBP4_VIBPE|nr:DUF3265 domain-containing protein [Vibrio pelagius]UTT87059.1 DUF3265 domain-containing protein [Vibrio pelagius]
MWLTICLRVIRNTWHFRHALRLVFKVVCGGFGIAWLTPQSGVIPQSVI